MRSRPRELSSLEARIAADRAKYGETPGADASALARAASRMRTGSGRPQGRSRRCWRRNARSPIAEAKPATDANRARKSMRPTSSCATARAALDKARAALADVTLAKVLLAVQPVVSRRRAPGGGGRWPSGSTSRDNPLTARVAVNHIWARHFHAPLVASVYDFGRNGARPTHPELLDWLAVELMETGWSMKHLHRLIVTSAAYRRVVVELSRAEMAVVVEN